MEDLRVFTGNANRKLARAICRRAERSVVTCGHSQDMPPCSLRYLNRLSDLLFVISRVLCRHDGGSEVLWKNELKRK